MPNTAPPARYDFPWKAALSHAFHPFLQFYFPKVCARIDWRQRPRFRDKEFARCSFGCKPDSMVADKLLDYAGDTKALEASHNPPVWRRWRLGAMHWWWRNR